MMTYEQMIEWLERELAETLLECRRETFRKAIEKIKVIKELEEMNSTG